MKNLRYSDIIRTMDVFIAEEAVAGLRADALITSPARRRGLLLGHRRGPRYFVARVFPLGGRSFPAASRLRELDGLFEGRVIGFYAGRLPAPGPGGILQPFAYGKLFLRVSGAAIRSRTLAVKPSIIEYDKTFHLSPISLAGRRP
jgi:hypothetical protein